MSLIRRNPVMFPSLWSDVMTPDWFGGVDRFNPTLPAVNIREEEKEFIEILVEDTGIGIPKKHLPRLGERFYRVDQARSRDLGGTGLGLAIVKHLVKAHGWEMKIESTEGKGTTVSLILPEH